MHLGGHTGMLLSVDNINLSFGGLKALKDVSFSVKEAEVFYKAKKIDSLKTDWIELYKLFKDSKNKWNKAIY